MDLAGTVLRSYDLLRPGKNAILQYPLLSLDTDGTLYAAWTTQKHGVYLYWDIHGIRSRDGGGTWEKLDGTPLATPILADDTGPTDRITADDEFEAHTWLSSFLAKDGKLHFVYLAQTDPPRQHYVRYDLRTARREIDHTPHFQGERIRIQGLDGFLAARPSLSGSPLYFVGHAGDGKLGCLASDDNGATWYDYAESDAFHAPYAVGGCREITGDGFLVGSFTSRNTPASAADDAQVRFLKIRAGLASARVTRAECKDRALTVEFDDLRGQPTRIRFRARDGAWSGWQPFKMKMRVPASQPPAEYQLKSRLGVAADAVLLPMPRN
jgi:hypothetical protein